MQLVINFLISLLCSGRFSFFEVSVNQIQNSSNQSQYYIKPLTTKHSVRALRNNNWHQPPARCCYIAPVAIQQAHKRKCDDKSGLSRGVPVYSPAFAGTHCAYPRSDGQAELTRVAGYIPRWFTHPQTVTHPSRVYTINKFVLCSSITTIEPIFWRMRH